MLEVLAELPVAGPLAGLVDRALQLLPVVVEGEGIEEQILDDQAVEGEGRDLLEEVGERYLVLGLRLAQEQPGEGARVGLLVDDPHDPEKAGKVIPGGVSELGRY